MIEGSMVGGRYAITRQIGEGGMGAVYEARHVATGRRVAIKVIAASVATHPNIVARLEQEAQAAGSLDSDHVTAVIDVGEDADTQMPYLVMEYLEGTDLSWLIDRVGKLPPDLVARIGVQVAIGLEAAHAKQIIHRDLKPSNVFLAERDSGDVRAKIVDFGIAKVAQSYDDRPSAKLTQAGSILGSPIYMSPEQARGAQLDQRSDVWSLGVCLFEAITGVTPVPPTESLGEIITRICTVKAPSILDTVPTAPAELAAIIERALTIDQSVRWASARDMREALERALPGGRSIRVEELRALVAPAAAPAVPPVAQGVAQAVAPVQKTVAVTPLEEAPLHRPVATVIATPTRPMEIPAAPIGSTSPKSKAPLALVALAALAAGGAGIFFATRPSADVATAATSTESAKPTAQASARPSASVAAGASTAPPATSSATAPAVNPLVGAWKAIGSGRVLDAVETPDGVEFRVHDASQFIGEGYGPNEPRFTLKKAATGDVFAVVDHVRLKAPPSTRYDPAGGPASCIATSESVNGKPLEATLKGDSLTVQMASVVTLKGAAVSDKDSLITECKDVDKIPRAPVTSTFKREP